MIINSLLYGNVKNYSINFIKDLIFNYTSNSKSSLTFEQQDQFNRVYNVSNMLVYRIRNDLGKEVNHFIANYYQIGLKDTKSSLITSILELTWGNSFFHELRTKSQLGYVVSGGKRIINNVMYYRVIVQGSKMDPELIDIEIEKVILNLRKALEKFNNYALDDYKYTLKNQIIKPDVNLNERFSIIWSEIAENTLEFDRKFKLINELNSITVQDVLNAFDKIFFLNPRKLSIQIYSGKSTLPSQKTTGEYYLNKTMKYKIINDFNYFRTHNSSTMSLYKPSPVRATRRNFVKASMIRKLK
jgi:secreted Zn-dependent insulinase-like peptidase